MELINDKNHTPLRFVLNYARNLWGEDNFGPPEI